MRVPGDWRLPGTPGVNRVRWTRDAEGTIHIEQIDEWARDDSFVARWIRIGDAPGS